MIRFYFSDSPQYAADCSRAHAAHLLRCWRRSPRHYRLVRLSRRKYSVTNTYPGSPEGILET